MTDTPSATRAAKRVQVQLDGDEETHELWVKPWQARVGAAVMFRRVGPDWAWRRGVLKGRLGDLYVIQTT